MPTATKRGKKWRARANVGNRQIAAGSWHTKAEALAAALEVERRWKAGSAALAHGKRVSDVLDRYAREVSEHKRGKRWEQTRLRALVRQSWATLPAAELTPDVLGRYRDQRLADGVAGSTVIREFNLLSDVFNVATREWRWMDGNPLQQVRRPKDSPPRTRRLLAGEIEALRIASGYRPDQPVETTTQAVVAMAEFAVETAMRSGEICALWWELVRGDHVHLPREITKTEAPRDVPLSARAQQILGQFSGAGGASAFSSVFGVSDAQRDALWRKVCQRAMVKGLHFHDLRREATTRLATKLTVLELARVTGHRDLKILASVYYSPHISELAEKIGAA